jgi:kynurenine formamidase
MPGELTEETVIGWMDQLSNWGRWGPDDDRGTLNLITNDVRRRAAALVKEGESVTCAWPLAAQKGQARGDVMRFMLETGEGFGDEGRAKLGGYDDLIDDSRARFAIEWIGYEFHGLNITHMDSLSHYFWDGKVYNGYPAQTVSSAYGAAYGAVTAAHEGVFCRGILIDLVDLGRGAEQEDVEGALDRANLDVQPGDALFLRTGASMRRHAGETDLLQYGGGWGTSLLPWLRDKDVAVIGADVPQEGGPGFQKIFSPIHTVGLVAMGLWLVDNMDLEGLAEACARHNRWEFQVGIQPIPVEGATGSAVNPIATF